MKQNNFMKRYTQKENTADRECNLEEELNFPGIQNSQKKQQIILKVY